MIASVLANGTGDPAQFPLRYGTNTSIDDQARYAGGPKNRNYNFSNVTSLRAKIGPLQLSSQLCQEFLDDISQAIDAVSAVTQQSVTNASVYFWARHNSPRPGGSAFVTTVNNTDFYGLH